MSPTADVQFKNTFKPGFLLVFLALLVATLIDQTLNKQIENLIQSQQGLSNSIFVWGALSLISSLLFPLLTSFLCAHTLANFSDKPWSFVSRKFELGLIETLRAWGKTFLWCFAFIIPALFYYVYYLLTPFVVMFSKKYELGEVDALEYSKNISKKFFYRLNFWLAIFYMAIPLAISSLLDEYLLFRTHPWTAMAGILLETFIYFTFHFVVLKLFLRYLNEFEPDPSELTEIILEKNEAPHVADV
ncbi:MAG: hypothetical protein H7256_08035 [Bdellovibrio sp.]|nr:hypothetical protein [Bdellovibrio sp.]